MLYTQNHTVDPEALCIPGGIPRHNGSGLPFEVLHTPQRMAFTYNYNTYRLIPIGENLKVPANPVPSYFGTSIARWEGDTLVIETHGLRDSFTDKIWLDENGNPTSDQTRVVERWRRPDFHHFRLEMTVTDPKYYSRPFTFTRTWTRAPKGLGQQEYACNETNLAAEHIGPGAGPIGPDGNRVTDTRIRCRRCRRDRRRTRKTSSAFAAARTARREGRPLATVVPVRGTVEED